MTTTAQQLDTDGHDHRAGGFRRLLHHWPVAVGLLAASASLAVGVGHESVLITLLIACLCYAAAAATGRRWVSWVAIPAGTAVVVLTEVVGAPWWAGLLVVSVVVVALGCLVGARRPLVLRQAAALAAFGAVALVALTLSPTAALGVGGLGLAAHSAWDAWHLARREVVSRSLAVACLALDLLLGLGAVVLALV